MGDASVYRIVNPNCPKCGKRSDYYHGNICRDCRYKQRRAWYQKNTVRARELSRQSYARMSDDRKQQLADRQRERSLKHAYGIDQKKWDSIFKKQKGACAICKRTEAYKKTTKIRQWLYVDHCHTTGTVRGLLCVKCNIALGSLGDNEEGLQRALDYVKWLLV